MLKLISVLLLSYCISDVYSQFQLYDEWSTVDFDYDEATKREDLKSGKLKPDEVVIYDSQLYLNEMGDETLFVTTPNLFGSSPFSLSTVSKKKASDGSSLLTPFPDASWYRGVCNSTITSVYRIKIDRLQRLWVVDSGVVNQLTAKSSMVCSPQILVFDLKNNNTLLWKYQVPKNQHYDDSLLVNIELDIKNNDGMDTTAYISDVKGYRMLVYSLKTDSSFPIDNPYFNPFPISCFFRNINGVNFTLLNGLYSISIGAGTDSDRLVYFHGLSSDRESFIKLSTLSDPKLSQNAFKYMISSDKGFHSSTELMTPNGFLIFTNIENNSLMIWDSQKSYKRQNFITIAQDNTRFQFITGMQLIGEDKLLITSSRYQNVLTGRIAKGEVNYRVLINLDISKHIRRT